MIAQELAKEDAMYWKAVKKHDDDKLEMKKSLNEFRGQHALRKQEKSRLAAENMKQDYKKNQEDFHEFLRHSKEISDKRLDKEKEIASFWDKQRAELQDNRRSRRKSNVDYQDGIRHREDIGK